MQPNKVAVMKGDRFANRPNYLYGLSVQYFYEFWSWHAKPFMPETFKKMCLRQVKFYVAVGY